MDGSRISAKVAKGYRISARKVGLLHAHYRPDGDLAPMRAETLIGTLPASFDANAYKYSQPAKPGAATWTALFDPELTQPGDYLVGDGKTWFISSQDHLLPLTVVICTDVVSLHRPSGPVGFGQVEGYGGDIPDAETVLTSGWPVNLSLDERGERTDAHLPSDSRFGSFVSRCS